MSTQLPTRQQIDQAQSLEFTDRVPETTITIRAQLDGWPIEVAYRGKLEQLPVALKRLTAAGLTPFQPSNTPAQKPARARQERVQPEYNSNGDPCCPKHHKPLKQGQYGLVLP